MILAIATITMQNLYYLDSNIDTRCIYNMHKTMHVRVIHIYNNIVLILTAEYIEFSVIHV